MYVFAMSLNLLVVNVGWIVLSDVDAIKQKLAQLEDDGPAQAPETEA